MHDRASQRLTETAARLFQARGLSRVGINEIIREAEVARMSLYNNFRSKEALALSAYTALSNARQQAWDRATEGAPDAKAAVLAIFDLAAELARIDGFRGCAFIDLAAHVDPSNTALVELVRDHKRALRDRLARLAALTGSSEPETLGRQLLALWDGALSDAHIERSLAPITAARAAAATLLHQAAR